MARERFLVLLLAASGFAGIAYEVLYGRLLGDRLGSQFLVNAAILLTFLAGIGIGTRIAYRLWSWLPWVEAAIGGYALLVAANIEAIDTALYRLAGAAPGAAMPVLLAGCVALLAVPATLIGVSLPVLSGYLALLRPGPVFSSSYAAYNLGAALVVLASEYWLIRIAGIRAATVMVAAVDIAVAAAVLFWFNDLRRRRPLPRIPPPSPAPAPARQGIPSPHRPLAALVMASIGSAVFQLLLIKLAECLFGPFRDTFALVLGLVFAGIAGGSYAVKRWRLGFGPLMVITSCGLTVLLCAFPLLARAYAAWHPLLPAPLAKFLFLLLAAGLPTAGFGATIPALLRRHLPEKQAAGGVAQAAGRLLFWSSLANALGFLLMVFVLHPRLDYGAILMTVILCAAASALILAPRGRSAAAALFLALAATLLGPRFWDENLLYLGHTAFDSPADLDEARNELGLPQTFKGPQDVFSILPTKSGPRFFINGYISMTLDSPWEPLVGAVAASYAPRLDRALVLGVGSGNTAGVVGQLFAHTDGVEINGVVLANLHRMRAYNFGIVQNPRVRLIHDDAIHFVKEQGPRYSLVVNTVTTPLYFSSAKLYTEDFLTAVKARLTPDGLYVTWVDSRVGDEGIQIMLRTLSRVFGQVALAWVRSSYFLLLCSDQPIAPYNGLALAREPALAAAFRSRFQIEPAWVAYCLLAPDISPLIGDPNGVANRLDYPALEFAMSRLRQRGYERFKTAVEVQQNLSAVEQRIAPYLDFDPVAFTVHAERLLGDCRFTRRWLRQATARLPDFASRRKALLRRIEPRLAAAADTADAYHKAGFRLLKAGLYREAIELFRTALAKNPRRNNTYFNIGACYEYLGEYEAALTNYRKELEVDPDDEDVAYRLGRVYVKMGRFADALPLLRQAVDQGPTGWRWYYLGRAQEGLGDRQAAHASYRRGLELAPGHARIRQALTRIGANP
ncbi:MAG TPA: tetratricopeptide repeat protein [Desulfobacterales bacterium]|nr:tetratricopeptide repeat protein [Desulfobacterales bacterium]